MDERVHKKFSFARSMAVSTRILRQFKRDRMTFGMIVLMPILFMYVFGMTLSGDIKNVPIIVENLDDGFMGESIYAELLLDDRVSMKVGSYQDGKDMIDSGDLVAAIHFGSNFTTEMILKGNASIKIYIDGTKPQIKGTVYAALSDAMQVISEGKGVKLDEELAFGGAEFSGLDVTIPGVMGYVLTFLILLLAVLTVIREDIGKTKLRLFTTPLTPVERVLGYSFSLSLLAMLETALVLGIAIFIFGTVVQGSLPLLFFAGLVYGLANIFLAFFLSNFAKNEFQSVQLAVLVAIPSLAFSGMMIPTSSLPPVIAAISKFIPLTFAITIFEGIMLRGWGAEDLWFEFTLIIILTIAFFILALISSSDKSKD
ncbi:MAG: ABC transporter permease [Candidatus Hodarchaeales archaeon]|jgi:ABC-2 type transport system permease protein